MSRSASDLSTQPVISSIGVLVSGPRCHCTYGFVICPWIPPIASKNSIHEFVGHPIASKRESRNENFFTRASCIPYEDSIENVCFSPFAHEISAAFIAS